MRCFLWCGAACLLGVGLVLLYRNTDPSTGHLPACIFYKITGWYCPGCGSQRFAHALLNGNAAEALAYNYFLPFGVLMAAVCVWLECTRRSHPERYRKAMRPVWLYIVFVLIVLWTVVRNIIGV